MKSSKSTDLRTARALNVYAQSLARELPAQLIVGLILFGSRARGDHNSPPIFTRNGKLVESDIDVAVVMRGKRPPPKDAERIEKEPFDFTIEALNASKGLMLDPIAVWESDLQSPIETSHSNLYQSIVREGIEWHGTA